MNHSLTFTSLALGAALGLVIGSNPAAAQEAQHAALAKRIVTTSVNIQPGDVVVVAGGKHNIDMMEALAVEATMAGGMVTMFLNSDRVTRTGVAEADAKYLDLEPTYFANWLKDVDVWIGLPGVEDSKAVFADVPEDRLARSGKAAQVIFDMLNGSNLRGTFIAYPSKQEAAENQLDFATLEGMHWKALNEDYQKISAHGAVLQRMLQGANEIRVTSPAGTDIRFSIGERKVFLDDGIVTAEDAKQAMFLTRWASLPGGAVFTAPLETSANGRVVVPKHRCRYQPMTGATYEFTDGKVTTFEAAAGGECYQETMAPYTGPKDMFASFQIGLNPGLQVIEEGGDYRPGNAAGMVWLTIGGNSLLGGANQVEGEAGFGIPVTNATVEIDGKIVVQNGELTTAVMAEQ
jgi:leucyl aminopeptidase (aminopeptidase T)